MKSFQQFLSESVNISGNASVGTIIFNSSEENREPVGENFLADISYNGSIHRLKLTTNSGIPTNQELTEKLQDEYPGAIVHTIYSVTISDSQYKITDSKRYHPSKLEWI